VKIKFESQDLKWWKKPLRGVTLEFPGSDIRKLNVQKIIHKFANYGINLINVFAIGYYPGGAAYYQSKIAYIHPDLNGRDLLAESIEETQKYDIKTIAYVNVLWGNRKMFEEHPDWAQRRADGKITTWDASLNSVAMCPNTKYRDYILQIIKEIANNYQIDGFYFDEPSFQSWCYCIACQKQFLSETNEMLPNEANWQDQTWRKFINWRYKKINDFKDMLYRTSKSHHRIVFFQYPFPLSFWCKELIEMINNSNDFTRFVKQTAHWYVPLQYAADIEHTTQTEDIIQFELYRKVVCQPIWWYGICLRLGSYLGSGKPMLVLNMQGYSPFDLYSLPEAELRLAVAEIIANRGNPLFAYYYPDIADERGWKKLKTIFDEYKTCDEYFFDLESVKFVAVLHSPRTADFFDSEDYSIGKHTRCLMGICKMLLRNHILFDIITERELEKVIHKYRVLILPNVSSISRNVCDIIKKFVSEGGGVLATYKTSLYNEDGIQLQNFGLNDLFGVDYLGKEIPTKGDSYMKIKENHPVINDLPVGMYLPSFGNQLFINVSGSAKSLATLIEEPEAHYLPLKKDTKIPTIVVNEFGKGRVVYIAGAVGEHYLNFGIYDHSKIIINSIRWLSSASQSIEIDNCPSTVELTAYTRDNDTLILHLVNSVRDEINEPIYESGLISNVIVKLKEYSENHKVKLFTLPNKQKIFYRSDHDSLLLRIPNFKYHQIVVVESIR
jgi:hypothetical protein